MRKLFFASLLLLLPLTMSAQQSRQEIDANPLLAANTYLAYPGPQKQLTPAPKGYEPYYLSHYGRHGSRYMIGKDAYTKPYLMLAKADSLGKLTDKGKEMLALLKDMAAQADGRDGELTQLGALQHRQIAQRMYDRFPEIFKGKTNIDARSTVVIRCILSMENGLQQLLRNNTELNIRHDASYHDMYFMNLDDCHLDSLKRSPEAKAALETFNKKHENYQHLMGVLFNDENYWKTQVNGQRLCDLLFNAIIDVQDLVKGDAFDRPLVNKMQERQCDSRHLYDIFTKDEIYDQWLRNNAYWYVAYGTSPLSGGVQPWSQRNLLRRIIADADSCLRLDHPGATLRYGHDTMVCPLTCLLNLNGYGETINDLEQLDDKGWTLWKFVPMAANIQFVFYRPVKTVNGKTVADPSGKHPILVKILSNEDEATLPIATSQWPYYKWSDVRAYCLQRLAEYQE